MRRDRTADRDDRRGLDRVRSGIAGAAAFMLILLIGVGAPGSGHAAGVGAMIDVVTGGDAAPYLETLDGLREGLAQAPVPVSLRIVDVGIDGSDARRTKTLGDATTALVVCIGSVGCAAAERIGERLDAPLVAVAVSDERAVRGTGAITGVHLEVRPERQLGELARLFPRYRRVGLLYDAVEGSGRITAARLAADALGLELIAIGIASPLELPAALRRLMRDIDVLWAVPDPKVLNRSSAREVMLAAFRARVPLIGASRNWVRSGALYALDRDYEDMGRQAAEMARALLAGTLAEKLPPVGPRRVNYSVNLRTAKHVNAELSRDVLEGADEVFD